MLELSDMCNTPGMQIKDIMGDLVGEERWLDHLDTLLTVTSARRMTKSRFARENAGRNIIGKSNGETALDYFYSNIQERGLYLLDEPENSLSPQRQMELAQFLEDSARFFGCQMIIATHSPFLLALKGARIYDLDADPVAVCPWTQLPSVQAYYQFFKNNARAFEK